MQDSNKSVLSIGSNNRLKDHHITVGLCVKNNEAFIDETMASLIYQDFPLEQMELLVVDGYSKDKTIEIIKHYASKANMVYRIFFEKEGLGVARQMVVDKANGKYIVWVDGDLVLSRNYVRILFELMEANPNVGIAKGKYSLSSGTNSVATLEIYSRAAGKMVDFNSKIKTSSMGTAGCIYRVDAIREIGGFDSAIFGYGEDWDAEYRVRAAGWLLRTADIYYRDYERRGLTWSDIWRKYLRRGYDSHLIFHKNEGSIELYKWTPFAALVSGFLHSLVLYRLTGKKIAFFLPLQYAFKMTAWCLGFRRNMCESPKVERLVNE